MRRFVWILLFLAAAVAAGVVLNRVVETGDQVRLQLSGPSGAQFTGYFAAADRGFYKDEGLNVQILPGDTSASALGAVVGRQADVAVSTLQALLNVRSRGFPLVNIAQIFQYSGLRLVAFKEAGISLAADLRGRRVGIWRDGSEMALLALLEQAQIAQRREVSLVAQPHDISFLLTRQVDAAMATTYRDFNALREAGVNTETLSVIDFNREGTAVLEDGLVVREDWIGTPQGLDLATRFLKASLRGWEFCRDRPEECGAIVARQTRTDRAMQTQMVTEINKLIWGPPAPKPALGFMDPAAFAHSVALLSRLGAINPSAAANAYTHNVWMAATRR